MLSDEFVNLVKEESHARYHLVWKQQDETSINDTNVVSVLRKELIQHVSDRYGSGGTTMDDGLNTSGCLVSSNDTDSACISLVFGGEKVSKNYDSSRWVGFFKVDSNDDPSCKVLYGYFDISSHFFENCNFDFKYSMKFESTRVLFESDNAFAKAAVKQISLWEEKCVNAINELTYDSKLKTLRRVMPITRRKMDWAIQQHRLVKILEKSSSTVL